MVAPDQRGCGLSGKPEDGYDTATLAGDLVALMDALGHERFAVVGHDTGLWIGCALAADHPGRIDRLAVAEAAVPGVSPSPPLFGGTQANDRLWHFTFNRLAHVNEQLVQGRKHVYFGWQRRLLPRGGSRGGGGGADRVPRPVPKLTGRGAPPQDA